jgi:TIR domain
MSATPTKSIIFISYAHADEPERPSGGEVKWLSFVASYFRPAEKQGVVEVWTDRLMLGGDDWNPEIESKLRGCDIFVLLVSPNSMGSDYIVDKEIAIIRERQANGENVRFYPLLLTPTPKSGLDAVRDKNLRPRDGKPLSSFSLSDRQQQMSDAADEIVRMAGEIAAQRTGEPSEMASMSSTPSPPGEIDDRQTLDPVVADRASAEGFLAKLRERALEWARISSTSSSGKPAKGSPDLTARVITGVVAVLVALGVAIWGLHLAREFTSPKDCELTALMTWTPPESSSSPLYVELASGDLAQFAVGNGIPVALSIPAGHIGDWTLTVVWSDRTRSQFGKFSECYKNYSKESDDKRVLLSLESR